MATKTNKKTKKKSKVIVLTEYSETLQNPKQVSKTVMHLLEEGDHESALEVLAGWIDNMNKTRLEKVYGIPRRTSYNLLNGSKPKIDLVSKILAAVKKEAALAA